MGRADGGTCGRDLARSGAGAGCFADFGRIAGFAVAAVAWRFAGAAAAVVAWLFVSTAIAVVGRFAVGTIAVGRRGHAVLR
ncbi:hypothetical protein GCM10010443_30730 [Actinoplanes cyaneus]